MQFAKLAAYGTLIIGALVLISRAVVAPREVVVAPVTEMDVVAEVQGTGPVTTKVLVRIGSKITGRVEEVLVEEGDLVKPHSSPVVILEDTDFQRQVERAQARLDAAKASAWEAKRSFERQKRLLPSGAASQEQVDVAEERYRVAESQVAVEKADLRYHEFKVTETRVPALVSGMVTKRWVEPGDAVVAGQPLVTVADTSVIWVEAYVDQRHAGKLQKGQQATVMLRGRPDEPFRGQVERVNPEADPVTEEMLVEVSFPLPPEKLLVGEWAEVFIEVATVPNAVVVPKAALMPVGNDRFVFVAEVDGTVRRVKVEPGASSPRSPVIAVSGDVKPGDRVILRPIGLRGGEQVIISESSADAN